MPRLDTNYVPISVINSISRKLGQPSYPLFFTMVKTAITSSSWAVANPTLYNSPWSYDTQNRFFSLQPLGAGKDTTFTIRYLGNPVNVAFKGKHTVSGKDEPCLCFMFPSETEDADNVTTRLVQPCTFVSLLAFEGYRPIPLTIIKECKAGKTMSSGGWFKKLWGTYSKEEQTEYKQPHDQQPVYPAPKNTPPKTKKQQTILQSLHAGGPDDGVLSDDDKLGSGEEGDKEKSDDEHVDVGGATNNSNPSVGRSTVGEKSPRFDLTTWDGCLKFARLNMTKEAMEQIKDEKNARKFEDRLKEALELNPDYDKDDLDCSDASSVEQLDYDSGFERMVSEEADDIFERETKKIQRSSSSGSTGSGGTGKMEKFEL